MEPTELVEGVQAAGDETAVDAAEVLLAWAPKAVRVLAVIAAATRIARRLVMVGICLQCQRDVNVSQWVSHYHLPSPLSLARP